MKNKKLLAIILLSLSFCFVSAVGYGRVRVEIAETKATRFDIKLLDAKIDYILGNPNDFLYILLRYDPVGTYGDQFPRWVITKDKIVVVIWDIRNKFSGKSEEVLLSYFKVELEDIVTGLEDLITDINTDVVAIFYSKKAIPLGYFYQGEYHLWED